MTSREHAHFPRGHYLLWWVRVKFSFGVRVINKKNELNIMVEDIKPHKIGITESWANNDITDAELGLEGYVMFRKDRMGRRGGVLLYI